MVSDSPNVLSGFLSKRKLVDQAAKGRHKFHFHLLTGFGKLFRRFFARPLPLPTAIHSTMLIQQL